MNFKRLQFPYVQFSSLCNYPKWKPIGYFLNVFILFSIGNYLHPFVESHGTFERSAYKLCAIYMNVTKGHLAMSKIQHWIDTRMAIIVSAPQ